MQLCLLILNKGEEPAYHINYKTDLKPVHESWIPAKSVQLDSENLPIPDKNGHTPGKKIIIMKSVTKFFKLSINIKLSKFMLHIVVFLKLKRQNFN